ncbi:hypothetical protein B879_00252 [Cecembia lonarensis LW9]|uniref:Cyclic nucleotide-binding domain-containing protein n=1 Tax=Cecembia lonarensis (strain CCUG 58316 / KCTC 22772 / LW9) TaxID=1225176 RepID=K1L980_CECL9|nr:hypothetical protein B879_00252 [Cecembia lonarensis LW9]
MTDSLDYFNFLRTIKLEKATIIQSLFQPKTVKKNSYLLAEGQICKDNFIIVKGVAKKCFIFSDKEIVTDIYLTGDIEVPEIQFLFHYLCFFRVQILRADYS